MPYIQPRGRKRKLKIIRALLLIILVIALGFGSIWTYNTFFKSTKVTVKPDDVLTEMKGTYTRKLVTITNPFDYVANRADSVTIDGKVTDLTALYNQYEPYQYYLAEPMTEAEINAQFLEIYLFLKPIYKEMISRDYTAGKRIDMFGNEYDSDTLYYTVADEFAKELMTFADQMHASTDPTFDRFKVSFVFDDIRQYVMYKEPRRVFLRMQDKPGTITRYDREIFVRMFKVMNVMIKDLYTKHGIAYNCLMCPVPKTTK